MTMLLEAALRWFTVFVIATATAIAMTINVKILRMECKF
jgi:hypothetical protein